LEAFPANSKKQQLNPQAPFLKQCQLFFIGKKNLSSAGLQLNKALYERQANTACFFKSSFFGKIVQQGECKKDEAISLAYHNRLKCRKAVFTCHLVNEAAGKLSS